MDFVAKGSVFDQPYVGAVVDQCLDDVVVAVAEGFVESESVLCVWVGAAFDEVPDEDGAVVDGGVDKGVIEVLAVLGLVEELAEPGIVAVDDGLKDLLLGVCGSHNDTRKWLSSRGGNLTLAYAYLYPHASRAPICCVVICLPVHLANQGLLKLCP